MLDDDDFDSEFEGERTFVQRYGLLGGGAIAVIVVGLSVYFLVSGGSSKMARPHNEPHITQVMLPPPPPPPPPPKTPPPPPKQQQVMQRQREPTPQKAISRPAPKAPSPPAAVTTSIAGTGPGSLALGNGGGGDCIGQGCGTGDGGGGGDNDAYYSDLVKSRIQDALRRDRKLEFAKYRVTISFTLDPSGNFTNASIASFSGDDDAREEVERVIRSASTGDTPVAGIIGKQFSVRIDSHQRG